MPAKTFECKMLYFGVSTMVRHDNGDEILVAAPDKERLSRSLAFMLPDLDFKEAKFQYVAFSGVRPLPDNDESSGAR